MRSALLITGSIKRVRALRHQTGAQYSAVEYTRARVAVRRTEALAPHVVPASCLINETLVLSLLIMFRQQHFHQKNRSTHNNMKARSIEIMVTCSYK